ncbi:BTAD domain-containing putative transcriptional regulator [Arthrobacter sp. ISL-28]|uniref:ATP-binding protein n=1 Tax=Arthrobacter sp. ISL-28 TaxID=2819108 RepID=UPI00288BB570|nr:BTAD domain-containing putative transcriptional regulator [Arthrobacter sp. ISL-28]
MTSQRLASRSGGYVLTLKEDELDLLRFREEVAAGGQAVQDGNLLEGADCLRQAVQLFRGPAFPDLADMEVFRPELDELEESRLDVYQDLIEIDLTLGRHRALVGELLSLVALNPYRERLWASLVLALYRSDRQADALAACRDARRVFADELGIDPGPRLRGLEQSVLQQDPSLAAPALEGRRRIRQRVDNLPSELTPLVGRETELGELCSLFVDEGCRLITITGSGGTGKTRLALAAAGRLTPQMADGACWVNLAPLTQDRQVPAAIANALGLEDWAGVDPIKSVTRFLRSRRLLMVLDNFEHLEEAWPVVVDMLTAAPDLWILTTSRRPLGLRAEYEYELEPLALPPLDPPLPPLILQSVPAVKLFLTRGRTVRPRLNVNGDNAAVVTRLCRRLDGLPLAIELAAAQLRYRSESELLNELEVSFAALPAAFRDLPDRQRTLTATIAWSYGLLDEAERQLFDRLGVFAADPTVTAVSSICGSSPAEDAVAEDLLTVLSRHSLLRRYVDSKRTERISMLQTIREFARDRLESYVDALTVRRRHAEYYLSVAEVVSPHLWAPGQVDAFHALHADAPDLRGAFLWAAGPGGSTELALRLVGELWHYWELTGDVAEQCEIALKLISNTPTASPALRAPALSGTATLCWMLGRNDDATDLHHRALKAFEAAGNDQGVAWSTACLAVQASERDDNVSAERLASEALSLPLASPRTRICALIVLSLVAYYSGDIDKALALRRESAALARQVGDRWILAIALTNLAECMEQIGDYPGAERLLLEAISGAQDLGGQGQIAGFLEQLADAYVEMRRTELAIRVLAAVDAYRKERGLPLFPAEQRHLESVMAKARTQAGTVPFALAWAAGQELTLTQVLNEVLRDKPQGSEQDPSSPQQSSAAPEQPTTQHLSAAPWASPIGK